jgi:hypothetical protein
MGAQAIAQIGLGRRQGVGLAGILDAELEQRRPRTFLGDGPCVADRAPN